MAERNRQDTLKVNLMRTCVKGLMHEQAKALHKMKALLDAKNESDHRVKEANALTTQIVAAETNIRKKQAPKLKSGFKKARKIATGNHGKVLRSVCNQMMKADRDRQRLAFQKLKAFWEAEEMLLAHMELDSKACVLSMDRVLGRLLSNTKM